ncbi:MAG TPA: VanW family protein [bacterium]|nr:VanW family protein [bacterium]
MARGNKRLKAKKLLAGVIGLLVVLGVVFATYSITYADQIYLNQKLGSLDLGGKTKAEAKVELRRLADKYLQETLTLKDLKSGDNYSFKPSDIGSVFDIDATLERAWSFGRSSSPLTTVAQQFQSLFRPREISFEYVLNDGSLESKLSEITKKIEQPAKDYAIVYQDDVFALDTEKKEGLRVDIEMLKKALRQRIGSASTAAIEFSPEYYKPKVSEAKARERLVEANRIIQSGTLSFHFQTQDFPLDSDTLGSFVLSRPKGDDLEIYFNEERIKKLVDTVAKSIDTEPKNAKLTVTNGAVTVAEASIVGKKVDKEEAYLRLTNHLLERQKGQSKDVHLIDLKITETKPEISDNAIAELGLKELVSTATTDFKGSPTNRVHNITTGARALNGSLLKPGEEFSTLKRLGTIDATAGYLEELVIKEDKTIPEFGGGLCQVSSTLFRAALNAGMKITERQNHKYRVSYYEPPVGMDATIYDPAPDFKFLNNYGTYFLVQSKIVGTKITFEFYGTKDDRKIEIGESQITDTVEPGPPIRVETDTLPAGTEKRIEKAHQGATAQFTYKVTKGDQTLQERTFKSKYVPWQEKWLVGKGTLPAPTCTDGAQNGDEAGVDCGGSCSNQCPVQ